MAKSLGWVSLLEWASGVVATLTVGVVIWLATTLGQSYVILLGSSPNSTKTLASFLILRFFCQQTYLRTQWTFAIVTWHTLSAEVTLLTRLQLNYEVLLQGFFVWYVFIGRKVILTTFWSCSDVIVTIFSLRHHKSSICFQRRWYQVLPDKTKFLLVFLVFDDFFIQLVCHKSVPISVIAFSGNLIITQLTVLVAVQTPTICKAFKFLVLVILFQVKVKWRMLGLSAWNLVGALT